MSNPLLEAMESAGVRPLVEITTQVPLEPKADYSQRRLMAEIAMRSELQEKCQSTVVIAEKTATHPEGGFVTAMTGELVVMTKAQWAKLLGAVFRAGYRQALAEIAERSGLPQPEPKA